MITKDTWQIIGRETNKQKKEIKPGLKISTRQLNVSALNCPNVSWASNYVTGRVWAALSLFDTKYETK